MGKAITTPPSSMHQASSIKHLFCHQSTHHGSWSTFDQTDLDHFLARVFSKFWLSKFADLQVWHFENVEFGRFGIINLVQNRLVSIRMVFRSLQNHQEIVRVRIGPKNLRNVRVSVNSWNFLRPVTHHGSWSTFDQTDLDYFSARVFSKFWDFKIVRFSNLKMLSLGGLVLSIRSKIGYDQSVRYSGASKTIKKVSESQLGAKTFKKWVSQK